MLEFGQDIGFMVHVIIEMISELHLLRKPMLRPVRRPSPKYQERRFSSVAKSNMEM